MPERVRYFEGKKYFWDGEQYDREESARAKEKEYRGKSFDVRVWPEEGTVLLYTRRVVKEVVVEGG
ncbi:hypothetical protein AMJ82_09980 [candidate division TA06 bacterium SM23_40]|uniref:Uncharacterized protein n=1 Tax=candidate division TA06 bacterium SM23_40 TaxID=1703774 RepID=A0A0S8G6F8_UNCT6|nr:MAG: hypothetical protein AMJ82_09980 [candidate division TA06 bacterium SM23_40]